LRIVVNHGDKLSDEEKVNLAKRWRANIFISGHTHRPKLAREGDIVFLNPGSPSLPKENPTVGIVEETDGEVEIKIIDVETGKVMME
jgi:putative phosphoesterase